jgi:hypothetical protein
MCTLEIQDGFKVAVVFSQTDQCVCERFEMCIHYSNQQFEQFLK